jgi:hypothetical protein
VIWGRRKAKILFARHLDNPNHLEPPHEFSFFAHAVFAPKSWSSEATLHKNELICPSSGNSVWSVDRKKNRCVETPSAKDGTRFAFAPGSHHLSWGYTASYAFGIVPTPISRKGDQTMLGLNLTFRASRSLLWLSESRHHQRDVREGIQQRSRRSPGEKPFCRSRADRNMGAASSPRAVASKAAEIGNDRLG